jgi:phosphate transport system ATP-binding protein
MTDTLTAPLPTSLGAPATLSARNVGAWFGTHQVLENVDLEMKAGQVTALIGPSGCGKSTFLRILNRMHELVPAASLSGEVLIDGEDIYSASMPPIESRRRIGMVFQKANPFPTMSIHDNVLSGLKLAGRAPGKGTSGKGSAHAGDLVEHSLRSAGLWDEVRNRLGAPGGSLSGGQQQRLCIARALAVSPDVLLMDEPCSALDPTSTRRVEETIAAIAHEVTVVIVTHNMQQAHRVSDRCAFFLAAENQPGHIVEQGATADIFENPRDERTSDYVNGRFG